MLRALPEVWRTASASGEQPGAASSRPDAEQKLTQLVAWAKQQMRSQAPESFGRALFEEDTHEEMHLTAETGLPTFHMGPIPDMLLRERIEDTSEASLARFNVRWVVGVGKSPTLGDENPDSEVELGTYHVRTLGAWDGKFLRASRRAGAAGACA